VLDRILLGGEGGGLFKCVRFERNWQAEKGGHGAGFDQKKKKGGNGERRNGI